jgi:acetyl-CoA/propionyl-CoA carboxylase carboxyl transferase subunit
MTTTDALANAQSAPPQRGADQKPPKLPREEDPRNPNYRLAAFFDEGTLELISTDDDSGMLAAVGTVEGVHTVAFCSDATIMGGAMGNEGCKVVVAAYARAMADQAPIVGLWHSGGARLAEGVLSLHAVGLIFHAMTQASGKIPQVSVVLGPAAGGAAYGPALTDVVILGPEGRIFVTGPDVVRSVTGEDVDMLRLGGPEPHGRRSGVVHVLADSEAYALGEARRLVSIFGDQRTIVVDDVTDRDLSDQMPESKKRAYDVHPVVRELLDEDSMLELHNKWAPNIVTALGRFGGRSVGVIANNPLRLGGCLDSPSAEKAARFVRMCDAFGIPLIVVVDVPGYLPGVGQEWDGVVRRGAKLLHAFSEAQVPRVTLVTRKSYGGAYIAMNSRALGATRVFAWPGAEIAVMGAIAAVRILHRRKIAGVAADLRPTVETELAAEHEKIAGGVEKAVEIGVIDEVVEPPNTRSRLAAALAAADTGSKGAHGNIPL